MKSYNLGNKNGSIIQRDKDTFLHRFLKDGRYTQITIKNASGQRVSSRKEAIEVVQEQINNRIALDGIETKEEYLLKVGQIKKFKVKHNKKLADMFDLFCASKDITANTLRSYKTANTLFLDFMNNNYPEISNVADLTEAHAIDFMKDYESTGISNRSYNLRLFSMQTIFQTVLNDDSVFSGISKKKNNSTKRESFSNEQLEKIYKTINNKKYYMLYKEQMRTLVYLGIYTGARLGDCACLKWQDIDLTKNEINFKPQKTKDSSGKTVNIPIFAPLRKELELHIGNDDVYVLPDVANRFNGNGTGLSKDIVKLIKDSKIKTTIKTDKQKKYKNNKYSFHSFRHTFVSICMNAGINPEIIKDMAGHTKLDMTAHYTHINREAKQNAIEVLPVLGTNKPPAPVITNREALLLKLINDKAPELLKQAQKILK